MTPPASMPSRPARLPARGGGEAVAGDGRADGAGRPVPAAGGPAGESGPARPLALIGGAAVLAAAALPPAAQLGFAILAIGGIGLAHGASDLAIVAPARRPPFLALYGAAALVCLLWWMQAPALALPLFLLASAWHFGMEDAARAPLPERLARGIGPIAIPALCHPAAYAAIVAAAGGGRPLPPALLTLLIAAGALAAALLLALAWGRRDGRLALGVAALAALPPLVGFSAGFLILHALPQTEARRRRMGCATTAAYMRAVAPVLVAALVLAGVAGALLLRGHAGIEAAFACMAALAVPHLLVTPWFARVRRWR